MVGEFGDASELYYKALSMQFLADSLVEKSNNKDFDPDEVNPLWDTPEGQEELKKYSQDQPRDGNGRFSSTGSVTEDSPATYIANAVNAFSEAGGKVESHDLSEETPIIKEGKDIAESYGIWAQSLKLRNDPSSDEYANGLRLQNATTAMENALRGDNLPSNGKVLIATDKAGEVVGALSYVVNEDTQTLSIGFLGTTQRIEGAGTALQYELLKVASSLNNGEGGNVLSSVGYGSGQYHENIGRNIDSNGISSWTADQVKSILGNVQTSLDVQKGDTPGHDFHGNQWTQVGGHSADEHPKKWAKAIISELQAGRSPSIGQHELGILLNKVEEKQLEGSLTADITNLRIDGTNLVGQEGLGYKREDMPQIPPSKREEFVQDLATQGISTTKELVDPRSLQPSQSEIGLAHVAHLYTVAEGQIPQTKYLLVSSDNYVVDGHHNWAADVALALNDPAQQVPILRVDAPAVQVISMAHQWATDHGYESVPLGKTKVKKGDTPGHEFHGNQWIVGHAGGNYEVCTATDESEIKSWVEDRVRFTCYGYENWEHTNEGMTEAQHSAVERYVGDGYEEINYGLRNTDNIRTDRTAVVIQKTIDASTISENIRVFRSFNSNVFAELNLQQGDTFRDPAFSSTSVSQSLVGRLGDDGVLAKIDVPAGSHGVGITHMNEGEILLGSNASFTFHGYDNDGAVLLTYLGTDPMHTGIIKKSASAPKQSANRFVWDAGDIRITHRNGEIKKGDTPGHSFHGNQYQQVEGGIKPENQKLPDGWRLTGQDEKTYTITSKKNNSAVFTKRAVPYETAHEMLALEGKEIMDWTPEHPIAVSALKSIDALATGKKLDFSTSELSSHVASVKSGDITTIKIGKLSTFNEVHVEGLRTINPEPSNAIGLIADEKLFGVASVFGDPNKYMEVVLTHELGHIDFTNRGLTVKDIQGALSKTADDLGIEKMPNWDRLEANYFEKVSSSYEKQGKEVPTDLLARRLGGGSAPLPATGVMWLQSIGATQYGSSRLQECYAECYAVWHTPNFSINPLVANMASMAGWGERPKGSA